MHLKRTKRGAVGDLDGTSPAKARRASSAADSGAVEFDATPVVTKGPGQDRCRSSDAGAADAPAPSTCGDDVTTQGSPVACCEILSQAGVPASQDSALPGCLLASQELAPAVETSGAGQAPGVALPASARSGPCIPAGTGVGSVPPRPFKYQEVVRSKRDRANLQVRLGGGVGWTMTEVLIDRLLCGSRYRLIV